MQRKLPVLPVSAGATPGPERRAFSAYHATGAAFAGVLSLHFESGRCQVRCPFCYLGQRQDASEASELWAAEAGGLDAFAAQAVQAVAALPCREVAITLSEPFAPVLAPLSRIARAARRRGARLAITTTVAGAQALRGDIPEAAGGGPAVVDALDALWGALDRLSVSIDPYKAPTSPAALAELTQALRQAAARRGRGAGGRLTLTLIVTLSQRRFAQQLIDEGLLEALVALPAVDQVALNALKPPPPFCDRAFWLRAMQRLGPLLRRELDRRLFLDCYVAARILGLGGCPGRPDLSPAPGAPATQGGLPLAYRSCVYQPAPDLITADLGEIERQLLAYTAPAVCPFAIP